MDKPSLPLHDGKAFQFFLSLFCKSKQGLFPISQLLGNWNNIDMQISLIEWLVAIPESELVSFDHGSRKQLRINAIQGIKSSVLPFLNTWCNIDLVEKLLELSDSAYYMKIRGIFEFPLKNCPEYLLLTIAQSKPKGGEFLLEELYANLLPIFLADHINSIVILERLWALNKKIVTRAIYNFYKYDSSLMNLHRILGIAKEIKDLLPNLLAFDDYYFTIPLAMLAGRLDFLPSDTWVNEKIKDIGEPFVAPLVKYIEDNITQKPNNQGDSPEHILENANLSIEKLTVIFDNLVKLKKLPERLIQQIGALHKDAIKMYPNLIAKTGETECVEDEANSWFHRVFSEEITIAELIECMQKYKNSDNPKQKEIHACMIHNLLDEYRFFNKYPEKELKITGQLFGLIIQNHLMDGLLERISIKYVFEALKRNGKMLKFGVYALEQFIDRLKEWPNSIEAIVKLSNIKNINPELFQKVLSIHQSLKPESTITKSLSSMQQNAISPAPTNVPQVVTPVLLSSKETAKTNQYENTISPPGALTKQLNIPSQSVTPIQAIPSIEQVEKLKSTTPPPKRDYNSSQGRPTNITNYQALIRKLESKQLASEFQSQPQNLPISYFPNLVQVSLSEGGVNPDARRISPPKDSSLEEEKLPSQKIIDNITRAFNLMNEQEMKNSIELTKSALEEDKNTLTWLANVIVKRASTEFNHHQLFLKLLNAVDNKQLFANVLTNLYTLIKSTLETNKLNQNPSDGVKKTMRNLGTFLGILTIAENRPILAKDLDLKEIIVDAYSNGTVTLAILLICPLLRQISNSKIFKPKNPWVYAIFCLILELRGTPLILSNLSLHYEINNLFEHLHLTAESFTATNILQMIPAIQHPIPKVNITI